jgi:endonuclease-3
LLIAVVLSAQCTDERVNIVTTQLFKLANTPEKMIQLGENKLKQIIYPCGFYNNKSKAILNLSKDIVQLQAKFEVSSAAAEAALSGMEESEAEF